MADAKITTEQIRNWVMDDGGLAEYHDPIDGWRAAPAAGRMFDRWLAEHDREVRNDQMDHVLRVAARGHVPDDVFTVLSRMRTHPQSADAGEES